MTRILGIAGSLREGSFNLALLRAAADLAPADCSIEVASIHGIPLYNADIEKSEGLPATITDLKEKILATDGLILATPEYNISIPGVFKNVLDWLTRPPADIPRLFGNRPVALCGASPGSGGTRMAQLAWLPILRALSTRPWFGKTLAVTEAHKAFDAKGRLRDEKLREQIRFFVSGFARFVASSGA